MWTYVQQTGELIDREGLVVGRGYAGFGAGKNNPDMQDVPNLGPIPTGDYRIGAVRDAKGGPHGPYVLPLIPHSANQMYGRLGFLIHGDGTRPETMGRVSQGCIIQQRAVREKVAKSGDRDLQVVAQLGAGAPLLQTVG